MRRMAFPIIVMTILVAGLTLGSVSKAARTGISEEDLLRSGHAIDRNCGAVTGAAVTADGEPVQLAAALKCEEFSDGTCVSPGAPCGPTSKKKKTVASCTTVFNKHKRASCACVR